MADQQTATNTAALLKIPSGLAQLIEGLIFAADEPLTVRQIKAIYEQQTPEGEERHIEQAEIQQVIQALNNEYQKADKAYRIVALAGGYQFATLKEYAEWIGRLYKEQSRRKLSQSSLESLAIIAYKQPISKPEIESIRGVNCDYVLKTLLEKELATIVGRAETVGRPLLYGTTREFLKHFGLNEVTDLPRPREIEEILGESQFETERRMLEAQAAADQLKKEEDFKSRLPHIPKKKAELDDSVRILPRKRIRGINTREPAPERDASKEQESIDFPSPVEETKTPAKPGSDAGADSTMEIVEGEASPSSRKPAQLKEISASVEENVPRPVNDEPEERFRPISLANKEQSNDVEVSSTPVIPPHHTEPETSQPRRNRWSIWKEKVQTFIKKLFG